MFPEFRFLADFAGNRFGVINGVAFLPENDNQAGAGISDGIFDAAETMIVRGFTGW